MDTRIIVRLVSSIRNKSFNFITNKLKERGIEGIVPQHGHVINLLEKAGKPIPMKILVEKSGKAKSTITSIIQTLQKYGYIEKVVCPCDARSQLVQLTEKGHAMMVDFRIVTEELQDYIYGDIPIEEREKIIVMMEKIEKNME